jgi:hypothetical protein
MIKAAHRRQFGLARAGRSAVLGLLLLAAIVLLEPQSILAQAPSSGWTTPEDVSAPISAGNDLFSVLICDPNQNLHVLWSKSHSNGSEIYYRTDAAGALSAPIDVLALADPLTVRLSATLTEPDSTLHVIWQNSYIKGDVFYSSAPLAEAGDPHAWDTPRLVVSQADSAGMLPDYSGSLHIVYGASDADGYSNSVYQVRSDDGGLTWSEPSLIYEARTAVPSTIGGAPAFDAAGRMHVGITIRSQEYGAYSELGYIRSLDGGQTWQPYQVIATQSEATPNVSVIAPFVFGADEIHLTYHDPRRMHRWSNDGGTTWSNPVQIIELGAGFGGANFLAKDSAGVLRAATGVANGVYVSTFDGSRWLAPERIESRSMDPHGQQLVVCQGNQLHVVYDDRVVADTTVWYSHKQVDAPHIEQSPIPTPVAGKNAVLVSREAQQVSPTAEPTAIGEPTPVLTQATPPAASGSALAPVLISTTLVVVFICVVLVWRTLRRR